MFNFYSVSYDQVSQLPVNNFKTTQQTQKDQGLDDADNTE